MDCETPEQVADAIYRLVVRGAPAIGVAAAYGLVLGLRTARDPDRLAARFAEVSELLGSTRPTAVNLRWALERGRKVFEQNAAAGPEAATTALLAWARELHADDVRINQRMGEHGAPLFASRDRGCSPTAKHGVARHRRLRQSGARRDPVRLPHRPPQPGLGGRDPAAPSRCAPHRLGAQEAGHPLPPGDRQQRRRPDGAGDGRRHRGGSGPYRGQRRHRQQDWHLHGRRPRPPPRRPLLHRRAPLHDRPRHLRTAPPSRSRSARRSRSPRSSAPASPPPTPRSSTSPSTSPRPS